MKVLIIDDDSISRSLLDNIMKKAGFTTDHANDGIDAFEHVNKSGPYDLLLVDWDMPRMDGLEFIKRLIEYNKAGKSKIVMITCHDRIEDAMAATALGIDSYLVKPIEVSKINKLLVSFGFIKDKTIKNDTEANSETQSD